MGKDCHVPARVMRSCSRGGMLVWMEIVPRASEREP